MNGTGHSEAATADAVVDGKGSPSIPRNVTVTDEADNKLRVTWDSPDDEGGLPATFYDVTLRQVDPITGEFTDNGVFLERGQLPDEYNRSWTFGEFDESVPAGSYKVEVYESNDRGDSPVYTSPVFTKVSSAISSAPRNVTATSGAANQVTVAWDAPETDGGKAVTDYWVVVEDGSNDGYGVGASFTGDARGGTVTGVKAGTWPVKVTAYNANGDSRPARPRSRSATRPRPPRRHPRPRRLPRSPRRPLRPCPRPPRSGRAARPPSPGRPPRPSPVRR